MGLVVSVAPTIEPVSLAEAKAHLRLDTGTFADELASVITLAPDAYPITPTYGIVGTAVDVLNKSALAQISVGTVAAGATLDAKIQESANGSSWTDWTGGAFTQITAAGTYEKQYTGIKQYIRIVATIAIGVIDFGASIITGNYMTADDTYIGTLITTARRICETFQQRAYITRTYQWTIDAWPCSSILELPMPPAIAISSIAYIDSGGTSATWTASEYQLDATGFVGRLSPAYGYCWPSATLRALAGITITYTAGYGATAASVPEEIRHAIMRVIGDLYENREDSDTMDRYAMPWDAKALLAYDKVISL